MCDCYSHKCEKCDARLPIHISDFCMERDEIRVYCDAHIPEDNVVVFTSLGGITVPIDTPKNRAVLQAINELRVREKQLRAAHKELHEDNENDPIDMLRCIAEESTLMGQLEERLLTPDEAHLTLPGYFHGDIWQYVVEDTEAFPKGSRIGVQFLCAPPCGYGVEDSVTPNVSMEYDTKVLGNPVVTDQQG